jgi:ribosomal-protein-alanine N-acetyltransferase
MNTWIETDRLILRDVREEDAPGFFELDADPEVHRFLGNQPVQTIEESEAVIQLIQRQYRQNGIGRWSVLDKTSGEFLGWSGLKYETQVRSQPYYDLGYRFRQSCWGKGIATEAALAVLQYGFEEMKLAEICAAADAGNLASQGVLQKVGMVFLETFEFDGSLHHWYRQTKDEWVRFLKNDGGVIL